MIYSSQAKTRLKLRSRRSEGGQVLIFGVIALLVLVVAIFVLFDLQSTIHYKIKAQSATDAAALVGAKWQKESLNLIGELNLVKACTALITRADFGIGDANINSFLRVPGSERNNVLSEQEAAIITRQLNQLNEASLMLTQMQARINFVGPLVGLGAVQQTAKNNGVNYNASYSYYAYKHYKDVCDESSYGAQVLAQSIPNDPLGYHWRNDTGDGGPYGQMLYDLLQMQGNYGTGFAVDINKRFLGQPNLYYIDASGAPSTNDNKGILAEYLSHRGTYEAILRKNWCALAPLLHLLEDNSLLTSGGGVDFDNITISRNSHSFPRGSEFLPLQLHFTRGSANYNSAKDSGILDAVIRQEDATLVPLHDRITDDDNYDPYAKDASGQYYSTHDSNRNGTADDWRFRILPRIYWCVYDANKENYDYGRWDGSNQYLPEGYQDFLRSTVKKGYDYKSGAYSFVGATMPTTTGGTPSFAYGAPNNKIDSSLWLTGRWSWGSGNGSSGNGSHRYLGDALRFGGAGSAGAQINSAADRLKVSEQRISNELTDATASLPSDLWTATSVAKPLGRISVDGDFLNPVVASMVLPVFDKVSLIPLFLPDFAFSTQGPPGNDPFNEFYYFLTEYMPFLGGAAEGNLRTMPSNPSVAAYMRSRYHTALLMLNDPAFRSEGLGWLSEIVDWSTDANGNKTPVHDREYYCTYWRGGSGGHRYGPAVAH